MIIKDGQAVGVQYIRNSTHYTVKARKEVILSAGVIGSPHILLLSGIGPKWHLDELKVDIPEHCAQSLYGNVIL